jgi:hypothetical protein
MLRLKGDLVRKLAVLPQRLVVLSKPGFRQVQPPIKQGRSIAAGITQEDPAWQLSFLPVFPHH